jgi:catechol 2,3-dioxygenase-like lactoylglutathione lyase family enzyme
MAIIGIESLVYGVNDVARSIKFFDDFGLNKIGEDDASATYSLPEGSRVLIRSSADPALPRGRIGESGVREVIWGVNTVEALEILVARVSPDREVRRDADGTAHFLTDSGVPMGLRLFAKTPVISAPDPLNAPGHVRRLNQHRKWRLRARPKVIGHVVFAIPDVETDAAFMRERLGFRLSDSQRGIGQYLRADGSNNHHNLLLLKGQAAFHHANFGVEDIDEIMVGANYMTRQGWEPSVRSSTVQTPTTWTIPGYRATGLSHSSAFPALSIIYRISWRILRRGGSPTLPTGVYRRSRVLTDGSAIEPCGSLALSFELFAMFASGEINGRSIL